MLIQIHVKQELIEKYWGRVFKNGCGDSAHRTLKLAVCQGKVNEID